MDTTTKIKPDYNKYRYGYKTEEFSCALCNKCVRYIEGPMIGKCPWNGPFIKFVQVKEPLSQLVESLPLK